MHACTLPLVLALLLAGAGGQEHWCTLRSVTLRFGNQPVDVVPAFAPETSKYVATLDFAMDAFSVDAVASSGCAVDNLPNQAIPVDPGRRSYLTISAKDPKTNRREKYFFEVSRLQGSETEVQSLHIDGAELEPPFDPMVRSYTAKLPVDHDFLSVRYILRDARQSVRCVADPQEVPGRQGQVPQSTTPTTAPFSVQHAEGPSPSRNLRRRPGAQGKNTSSSSFSSSSSSSSSTRGREQSEKRRLQEAQYIERSQSFLLDVAALRQVTLSVQSADPTQARVGTYMVSVHRTSCTLARPFYDAVSQRCVINCPAAFYPNVASHRCSECNTNCAVCSSLFQCQLCKEDTVENSYIIQPDGSCLRVPDTIWDTYRWWCVGFACFLALLCCLCCCLLWQYVWSWCVRRRPAYDDSDTESESERARPPSRKSKPRGRR